MWNRHIGEKLFLFPVCQVCIQGHTETLLEIVIFCTIIYYQLLIEGLKSINNPIIAI